MIKINNRSTSLSCVKNGSLHDAICEAVIQSSNERTSVDEYLKEIEVEDGRHAVRDTDGSLLAIVESKDGKHIILPAKGMNRFRGIRLINESAYSLLTQLVKLTGGAE